MILSLKKNSLTSQRLLLNLISKSTFLTTHIHILNRIKSNDVLRPPIPEKTESRPLSRGKDIDEEEQGEVKNNEKPQEKPAEKSISTQSKEYERLIDFRHKSGTKKRRQA
jgi:hypothetical protein